MSWRVTLLCSALLVAVVTRPLIADADQATKAPPQERERFHLYLLIGQSNMAGRGEMTAEQDAPSRVWKLDAQNRWVPAADPLHFDKPAIAGVGPGSGFGPATAAADESVSIGLIPCAVGGTPLKRWVKGGDLYLQAVHRATAAAKDGVLKGVLWHQGEADAGTPDTAETYAARLAGMIRDLRADLDAPNLPFAAGELGEFLGPEKFPHADRINAALRSVAESVPHAAVIDSAGLTAKSDQVHFNAESAREFGRRYARAMLALQRGDAVQHNEDRGTEDARLETFFREYLESLFGQRPLEATLLGDHRFDDRLDDVSPAARKEWVALTQRTLDELPRRVDYEQLSRSGQIDFDILRHHLTRTLWIWEHTQPFETDARIYNDYITNSVFLLLTQSTLPRERNIANAVARMKHIPAVIAAAREGLRKPTRVALETAIRQNRGAIAFYEGGIYEVAGETPQVSPLSAACEPVVAALKEHQKFLEELLPQADERWRLGKECFARKLELELNADVSADEVLAQAEAEFARVEREMYIIARQLWGTSFPNEPLPPDDEAGRRETIRRVLEFVSRDHGTPETLVSETRATVARIKNFIAERDILQLPDPDRCEIIEMPEFQRGNSTAYLNPAPPLDPAAESVYAVSPPPSDWSDERSRSFFEEYNRHMLQVLTIHEAYPGHYVQLEYSNRHPSLIRKVLSSGVFAEGWAVYTEQMMLDQGYGEGDLALRLNQLKFYLRAVGNAILDHKLHCTDMSDEEALDFLMRRAFQSEGEAVGKLVRAKQTSCQLSTYFVGRQAFYRLRQEIQRELGDEFSLGRFHEAVLDHGTLPVKYLPELVRARFELDSAR